MALLKAEEPPTAILYAHAAFLSDFKGARRRAALWYLVAADKLEKTGIVRCDSKDQSSALCSCVAVPQKPLAMYFFRKAHDLYQDRIPKELSPSFWESEDRSSLQWEGFSAVLPGIEHELGNALRDIPRACTTDHLLGRLLYTTGDTAGAVRYFLSLIRPSASTRPNSSHGGVNGATSPLLPPPSTDKVYLEDFLVAFKVGLAPVRILCVREYIINALSSISRPLKVMLGRSSI